MVRASGDIVNVTVFCVEVIVVRATVDIVQWYCVVCGVFFVVTATVEMV